MYLIAGQDLLELLCAKCTATNNFCGDQWGVLHLCLSQPQQNLSTPSRCDYKSGMGFDGLNCD